MLTNRSSQKSRPTMTAMTATEWLDAMSPWPRDGFGLGRIRALLVELGNPQDAYPVLSSAVAAHALDRAVGEQLRQQIGEAIMFLIANANVLPCHVMLISALARSASRTVWTN